MRPDASHRSQVFDLGVSEGLQVSPTSTAGIPTAGSSPSGPVSGKPASQTPQGKILHQRSKDWLKTPARVWREEMRGEPPWKQLAQQCKDLWNDPRLETQLRYYLRTTEPRFVSLAHFRRCFGRWETPDREQPRTDAEKMHALAVRLEQGGTL